MSIASPPAAVERLPAHSPDALLRQRFADYAELCRPRIAVMTMVSVLVGYTLSSPIAFDGATLLVALIGIVQLVAASSILNQCLERRTDAKMQRTQQRPIAAGRVSVAEAVILSGVFVLAGSVMLWNFVNPATAVSTLLTLVVYVSAYTPLKTRSALCTTIGAVPGAMPPVLGWLAAGGSFGIEALALFAVFFVWQFPHFLAIGWIHRKDYEAAGLKMLPSFSDAGLSTGVIATVYALAFVPVAATPVAVGICGNVYLWIATALSLTYLYYTLRFLQKRTDAAARSLLYNSLLCLPLLLITLVVDFLRLTSF